MRTRNVLNQANGAFFEQIFARRASACGLLALRNGQQVKWLGGGRMVAQKCQLDWTLVAQGGRVSVVDTKAFAGDHFTYSQIDARQLALAETLADLGVTAGFVVWLRASDFCCFYPAKAVSGRQRKRFGQLEGIPLGPLVSMDVSAAFGALP